MIGYIVILTNKIFNLYGSDVYLICFCTSLKEMFQNFNKLYLDECKIHYQASIKDIDLLQQRINNELTYNKLHEDKLFFMLPNLKMITDLINDLIIEQKELDIYINKKKNPKKLDKDMVEYNTTEDTVDSDKRAFRKLLKVNVLPNNT